MSQYLLLLKKWPLMLRAVMDPTLYDYRWHSRTIFLCLGKQILNAINLRLTVYYPSDQVRLIMKLLDHEGGEVRFPGNRVRKERGHLTGIGVLQEIHCDGHEKNGHLALRMGGVGIHMYGCRDHCTGKLIYLEPLPNSRDSITIGHVYLDMIEQELDCRMYCISISMPPLLTR